MSEFINNSTQRKEMLRHLLLRLHEGDNPEILRQRLIEVLKSIPYHEVVEVEQELINSNALTEQEILEFCDLHTAVLDGSIDQQGAKQIPAGHPVDTFKKENIAIRQQLEAYEEIKKKIADITDAQVTGYVLQLRTIFNNFSDIDKHYKRKEYQLFPFLEKHLITGPPKVMWGKHDETRELLKNSHEALASPISSTEELRSIIQLVLDHTVEMIAGMIMKEEEILLPMSMDTLTEDEWYKIYQETPEFGYCLIDPEDEWAPGGVKVEKQEYVTADAIRLSSGAFNLDELEALFLHLPIDITFVDKNDKVRFFSHSPNRVFERNRSIIGRDVRMCHPPGSVHIVEQILTDFRSGKENKAVFWMSNFQGRFIYIEYSAVRGKEGEYLGVVEVTQDITTMRKLEGDQRLLSYEQR
ncbi:Hypothetical protein PSM36_2507 [Proteiniphilum saccharofermentans]|uniref:DUF438 domain-containing protein n=1 Tax=Proteiniphilum saccharofermentans TaxID=1642647 RepID=A0A1R3T7P3_9BACT|nr:DUF438 domain-containing protein [Proteiniphilum saccharofermentans]SCD21308.1 Hypothetical protein PSM36_2507 [Proteiniphilum saccharofermentans]